nr:uncharacterized protein LOC106685803 isoform X2 [Halyomorpha halys]
MSLLPDNLTTALVLDKQGEDVNTVSLLFKVAYCFAQKGLIIYILSKSISPIPIINSGSLLQPAVLERIHFRRSGFSS